MRECWCVVGRVPSCPGGLCKWLAWVHCVVPEGRVVGPSREAPQAESIELWVLDAMTMSWAAAGANGTVEPERSVDVVPF